MFKISKDEGKDQDIDTIKYHARPEPSYGKVTKTQENNTHNRANRSAPSQQAATRPQEQTRSINNKKRSTKDAPPWNGQ